MSNEQQGPCPVCKFHWNLMVMPGDTHNRNCPHYDQRDDGSMCQSCGQRYKVDVEVPNDLWERIKPEGKPQGAGLLCGRCIFSRIEALGEHGDLTLNSRPVSAAPADGLQRRLYDECITAQWDADKRNTFAEEIAHLHEELSEAFRAWRRYKDCGIRKVNSKLEGVPIEFADVLIGLFYNAELHGFDLMEAVERKHQFNLTRNYVEEGRQLHPPAATTSSPAAQPDSESKAKAIVEEYKQRVVQLPSGDAVPFALSGWRCV